MHFTPSPSSWLNLVERFFRDLTHFITEKSFASLGELSDVIIGFLAERNANSRRYVWEAKGRGHPAKDHRGQTGLVAGKPESSAISETLY
jgi:hypothetical protein